MRCEDVKAAFVAAHYAKSELDVKAQAHLAVCVSCNEFCGAQLGLDSLLAAAPDATPRPGFDTRFFARLEGVKKDTKHAERAGVAPRRVTRWSWLALALPLTAAAAVSLVVWQRHSAQLVEQARQDEAIARDLELVENLPVVQQLDEVEAYEVLAEANVDDLDRAMRAPDDTHDARDTNAVNPAGAP